MYNTPGTLPFQEIIDWVVTVALVSLLVGMLMAYCDNKRADNAPPG